MLFMVLERYRCGPAPVYARAAARGRMLPDGLRYLDSWVDESLGRCWQVMEAPDAEAFEPWIAAWDDLVEFEVIPVLTSADAAARARG